MLIGEGSCRHVSRVPVRGRSATFTRGLGVFVGFFSRGKSRSTFFRSVGRGRRKTSLFIQTVDLIK